MLPKLQYAFLLKIFLCSKRWIFSHYHLRQVLIYFKIYFTLHKIKTADNNIQSKSVWIVYLIIQVKSGFYHRNVTSIAKKGIHFLNWIRHHLSNFNCPVLDEIIQTVVIMSTIVKRYEF